MNAYLFLDTNIWLHCIPVQDTDWPSIVRAEAAVVVVPPIVIDELDRLKDSSRSSSIRDRARRALELIEGWDSPGGVPVRERVRGLYWSPPKTLDLLSLGLSAERNDDILLASASAFSDAQPETRVVIVTDDTGPRLKARRLGLEVMAAPDAVHLPREEEPVERENRELRSKIQKLTARAPQIELAFLDAESSGENFKRIALSLPVQDLEEYVAAVREAAERAAPPIVAKEADVASPPRRSPDKGPVDLSELTGIMSGLPGPIPDAEYERYAKERDEYLETCARAGAKHWKQREKESRTVRVQLILTNTGTAPAGEIEVTLHIPDGPSVAAESAQESLDLRLPDPPRRPRAHWEMIQDSLLRNHRLGQLAAASFAIPDLSSLHAAPANVSAPSIRHTSSFEVRWSVRRLIHHRPTALTPIRLEFPTIARARSVTLAFRITSADLPDPVEGDLHLVVTNADG